MKDGKCAVEPRVAGKLLLRKPYVDAGGDLQRECRRKEFLRSVYASSAGSK